MEQNTPSSQAAPEDALESGSDEEEDESEEDHLSNVNPKEQEELAQLATAAAAVTIREESNTPAEFDLLPQPEEIYIQEPENMATATIAEVQMEEQLLLPINPNTGHRGEELAPSGGRRRGGWPPNDGLPGGGGGPPGGWPPVGPQGGPPVVVAVPPLGGNSKFVGQPPKVFTGERTKTEEFLTQWELYWGVNNNNTVMSNPYHVNEWLVAISRWLNRQLAIEKKMELYTVEERNVEQC
ncbi:hypothetical protein EDB85DRAFT_1895243 [Lactarius pseudohatsudake]|nr:hypothetical protein EDB85DRAFT_1895243 [Lactarius pseudohatsudake]